jgi:hypothetical protein
MTMLQEHDALPLRIQKRLECNQPVVLYMWSITRSPSVNRVMRTYHFLCHEWFVRRVTGANHSSRDRANDIRNIILQHRL